MLCLLTLPTWASAQQLGENLRKENYQTQYTVNTSSKANVVLKTTLKGSRYSTQRNQGQLSISINGQTVYTYPTHVILDEYPATVQYHQAHELLEIIFHVNLYQRYSNYDYTKEKYRVRLFFKEIFQDNGAIEYALDEQRTVIEKLKTPLVGPSRQTFVSRAYCDLNQDGISDEIIVETEKDPKRHLTSQKSEDQSLIRFMTKYAKADGSLESSEAIVVDTFDGYYFSPTHLTIIPHEETCEVQFDLRVRTKKGAGPYQTDQFRTEKKSIFLDRF
jgi:hypothetical protein